MQQMVDFSNQFSCIKYGARRNEADILSFPILRN